ncbi:MAG: hypothetical protein LRY50_10655 [Geovibrio sp.]|nr:hypothetical protein [Geovibrio sp.]
MKKLVKLLISCVMFTAMIFAVVGCGQDKKAETTAAPEAAAAAKTYEWKMATTWSTGIPWHDTAVHFAETVEKNHQRPAQNQSFPRWRACARFRGV